MELGAPKAKRGLLELVAVPEKGCNFRASETVRMHFGMRPPLKGMAMVSVHLFPNFSQQGACAIVHGFRCCESA